MAGGDIDIGKIDMKYTCYKCEEETEWLAPDGRCGDCTGFTPEQIQGEAPMDEYEEEE